MTSPCFAALFVVAENTWLDKQSDISAVLVARALAVSRPINELCFRVTLIEIHLSYCSYNARRFIYMYVDMRKFADRQADPAVRVNS